MFLHMSAILFTGGGGLPDRDPLWTDIPWTETPLEQKPPGQRLTWTETPYGKERAVRILLECIFLYEWKATWTS